LAEDIEPTIDAIRSTKLVGEERAEYQLTDEPRIPAHLCYSSDAAAAHGLAKPTGGFGTHVDPQTAKLIAYAECIERICLCASRRDQCSRHAYINDGAHIDPAEFVAVNPDDQPCADNLFRKARTNELSWWPAEELTTGKLCNIPAQAVFSSSEFASEFQIVNESNSSGAAFGKKGGKRAVTSGLFEAIERDATVGAFLFRKPLDRIVNLPDSLQAIVRYMRQYRLEPVILNATSDIGVPTVLVLTIDRCDNGLPLTTGAATGYEFSGAIHKALLESMQGRVARRLWFLDNKQPAGTDMRSIAPAKRRISYWSQPSRLSELAFWLENPGTVDFDCLEGEHGDLDQTLEFFREKSVPVYSADITLSDVAAAGFETRVVVVPYLHRLNVNVNTVCLYSRHYGSVPLANNNVPHPFM